MTEEDIQQPQEVAKSGEKEVVISGEKEVILKIRNLVKRFNEITAVNKIDLDVYRGEILGVIGPNGSGKTTLFNLISGMLNPNSGTVLAKRIGNQSPFYNPLSLLNWALKPLISIVRRKQDVGGYENIVGKKPDQILNEFGISRTFQIVRPFKYLNSQENVTIPHIPKNFFSRPKTLKSLSITSLLEVDLGEKKNYPALILPHGDLKRLDFARAIASKPRILLLDEPFSGLSAEDSFRVTQLIKRANKEYGTTIILVEHKLKLLSNLVTRIVVLDQGKKIAEGLPADIANNKEVIASYLGKEASIIA